MFCKWYHLLLVVVMSSWCSCGVGAGGLLQAVLAVVWCLDPSPWLCYLRSLLIGLPPYKPFSFQVADTRSPSKANPKAQNLKDAKENSKVC